MKGATPYIHESFKICSYKRVLTENVNVTLVVTSGVQRRDTGASCISGQREHEHRAGLNSFIPLKKGGYEGINPFMEGIHQFYWM